MFNCSSEITEFYNKHARLAKAQVDDLAGYRAKNITRLEKGLEKNEDPIPTRHINQGSYAMRTINQHPDNDYDIDIGVIFNKDDLVGRQGADKTALSTRKMVLEAVKDERFNKEPELKKNCVRVFYNEGYHIDMPAYRESINQFGEKKIELASSDWIESDPEAVTKWFNQKVIDVSPDKTNGRQMRRVVRLLKFWAKSRKSWNMPSGFIISKLVSEKYCPIDGRDDESLYYTMDGIKNRLLLDKDVYHPILTSSKLSDGNETAIDEFLERLKTALDDLSILFEDECTNQGALKAWKKIFNHSYFSDKLKSLSTLKAAAGATVISKGEPSKPVKRKGEARFA
ncbi:cyclic GMP-AMP synthase DncV-like nucleotidyltransferase [Desulfospira joergensenii]|uniref:cyclic GMP-AMP synthase DncV-like nucleotidyltransferase n=1 Tax=Desulfospira joergensenii TaxID=53329 RepID=UPI0003B694C9|nr:hypothetical protein [Desulfospira joergensenii]